MLTNLPVPYDLIGALKYENALVRAFSMIVKLQTLRKKLYLVCIYQWPLWLWNWNTFVTLSIWIFLIADGDRIIVQCFMNLVVLSVIFLLWANNPVNKKVATDWAEVAVLMDTRINHFLATISPQLWWISGPILQTTNTFSYTHTLKYISKCRHSPDANLSGGPLAWPGRPQSCANKLMKHNIAPFASWYSATALHS